jgi:hypothetical protein
MDHRHDSFISQPDTLFFMFSRSTQRGKYTCFSGIRRYLGFHLGHDPHRTWAISENPIGSGPEKELLDRAFLRNSHNDQASLNPASVTRDLIRYGAHGHMGLHAALEIARYKGPQRYRRIVQAVAKELGHVEVRCASHVVPGNRFYDVKEMKRDGKYFDHGVGRCKRVQGMLGEINGYQDLRRASGSQVPSFRQNDVVTHIASGKNRTTGVGYHAFRGGAEDQVIDAAAATGPHDDQVCG